MNSIFKNRRFKLFLAMISLLVLMNMIQDSYAKYISSASANSNFDIAKWTFKVNDQDVLSNSDFTNTIIPVIDQNTNIKDGYIAPTSTGYFDVTIDYSDVGVAFTEEISLSYPSENALTDLIFTGYSLNNSEVISMDGINSLSINHDLDEETTTDTYRFYIQWFDGVGEDLDNDEDTAMSKEEIAKIQVNLNFIQRAN